MAALGLNSADPAVNTLEMAVQTHIAVPSFLAPLCVPDGIARVSTFDDPRTHDVEVLNSEMLVAPFWPAGDVYALVGRMPHLKLLQALTAGVDQLLPIVPPGVAVCSARGVHDVPVAEWIIGAILSILHGFPTALDAQRSGRWGKAPVGGELTGSRVLIVGYGSIGKALEQRLLPFDADITRVARHPVRGVYSSQRLPELLPSADIVVLTLPSEPETHHMVDAQFLCLMHDDAILVNAGRGPLIDTSALLVELQHRRLRAALDVTDPEPLPDGHPLFSAPGALITPHMASRTPKQAERLRLLVAQQLQRIAKGLPPLNIVTTER